MSANTASGWNTTSVLPVNNKGQAVPYTADYLNRLYDSAEDDTAQPVQQHVGYQQQYQYQMQQGVQRYQQQQQHQVQSHKLQQHGHKQQRQNYMPESTYSQHDGYDDYYEAYGYDEGYYDDVRVLYHV